MIIFSNEEKSIQLTLSDTLFRLPMYGEPQYEIVMPKIICANANDAQYIQEKINEFAKNLIVNIIEEQEDNNE